MNKELLEQSVERGKLGQVVNAGGSMVQTEGGLIVPKSAVVDERTRRVWDWQMWKNLRRMIRFFASEEITMVLACSRCKQIMRPSQPADGAEGYNLECSCKVREIRPGK
jgi:hypothetical protein